MFLNFKKETIDIPLDKLCVLWTKQSKDNVETKKDEVQIFCNKLSCNLLKDFCREYLAYFKGLDKKYLPLVFDVINIIQQNGNTSFKNHTINVTKKAVKIIPKSTNANGGVIPEVIIAALVHDIGEIDITESSADHVYNGLLFLKKKFKEHNIDAGGTIKALKYHHTNIEDIKEKDPVIFAINQAETFYSKPPLVSTPVVKEKQLTISKEEVLKKIISAVDPVGFSAFYFEKKIYIFTIIMQTILFGEKSVHPTDIVIQTVANMFGIENKYIRLRFEDRTIKPKKNWYFVFNEFLFEDIPEEKKICPRDNEGRWLKMLNIVENNKDE
jgi:hypothetical protein